MSETKKPLHYPTRIVDPYKGLSLSQIFDATEPGLLFKVIHIP